MMFGSDMIEAGAAVVLKFEYARRLIILSVFIQWRVLIQVFLRILLLDHDILLQ